MEALLEKEGKVENWNDDRLDELSRRMDAGFAEMATKAELTDLKDDMNRRFGEADARFGRFEGSVSARFNKIDNQLAHINDRLDRMNNTLLVGSLGVIAALIANGIFG